jgi:hypothetical protein
MMTRPNLPVDRKEEFLSEIYINIALFVGNGESEKNQLENRVAKKNLYIFV